MRRWLPIVVVAPALLVVVLIAWHLQQSWNFVCPSQGRRLDPRDFFLAAAAEALSHGDDTLLPRRPPAYRWTPKELLMANPRCCLLYFPWTMGPPRPPAFPEARYPAWHGEWGRPTWRRRLLNGGWAQVMVHVRTDAQIALDQSEGTTHRIQLDRCARYLDWNSSSGQLPTPGTSITMSQAGIRIGPSDIE
jgi:hypothetical protein